MFDLQPNNVCLGRSGIFGRKCVVKLVTYEWKFENWNQHHFWRLLLYNDLVSTRNSDLTGATKTFQNNNIYRTRDPSNHSTELLKLLKISTPLSTLLFKFDKLCHMTLHTAVKWQFQKTNAEEYVTSTMCIPLLCFYPFKYNHSPFTHRTLYHFDWIALMRATSSKNPRCFCVTISAPEAWQAEFCELFWNRNN